MMQRKLQKYYIYINIDLPCGIGMLKKIFLDGEI